MRQISWNPNSWKRLWQYKFLRYSFTTVFMVLVVTLGFGRSPALAVTPKHYSELELPPAPEVVLPDYTRYQLDNGLMVYLLEDHELPLVYGMATIHTGDRIEPADQTGLASITATVMRSGGSQAHPADELNQLLEQRAASVEVSMDVSAGGASFSALSEDTADVLSLFAEVLQQPAFPEDKLELVKNQWRGSIARRNDDPDDIASRELQKLIYGDTSPYARTVEYATLNNISRSDLESFYQRSFQPQNLLLGIVGDFETETMQAWIAERFGNWPAGDEVLQPSQALTQLTQAKTSGVYFVDQPQLTQSSILVGHLGGRLDSPDYAALSVMNDVLNGLGGRLVNDIRSRQGLAYSVYAYWSPRFDYPGLFIGGGQTRSEATVPFVQSMLQELEKVRTTPILETELARAKDSVLNAFIFNFQTPSQILSRVMRYDYYGYPQDFIFQYQKQVETTTVEDVQRAAAANLKPESLVTIVVGNAAAIDPSLSALTPNSPVQRLDVTIPES